MLHLKEQRVEIKGAGSITVLQTYQGFACFGV